MPQRLSSAAERPPLAGGGSAGDRLAALALVRGRRSAADPTTTVVLDGVRLPLDPEHLVRVDAGAPRVLASGVDGPRVLCVGGVPGGVHRPPEWDGGG